jgi:tetratricopeptide (TPR) repeat protein
MVRVTLLGIVLLVATTAGAAAASRQPLFDEAELIAGHALPLGPPRVLIAVPTPEEVFALDDDMNAFVEPLKALRNPDHKMVELIRAMEGRGMFSLEYAEVTRTARSTFHDRQGNCLSFTMLFVTLARAAGLRASYQTVDVPPSWSYDGQVVVANHVNTLVRTGRVETIVDFNIRPYEGSESRRRRVADSHALGLFYTNLGAEAMLAGDYAAALLYLREAAKAHADLAGLWVNLGVLYSRHALYEHAEAAYLRALAVDVDEPSALANLALIYEALDEPALAAEYQARVQRYRERNPYYHFTSATRAYEQQQYSAALTSLRKALRLKPDEHAFHELRGQVQEALGNSRHATQSFERAREYAAAEALRAQSRVAFGAPTLQ